MGCITSKVITRSSSYEEEYLNRSFQRRENGIPVLEELLTSKNGSDQLVALVYNTNTAAKKPRSGSFTPESSTSSNGAKLFLGEPMSPETINSWELMAGLEEEQEHSDHQRKLQSMLLSSTGQEGPYDINNKRSKSFHLVRDDELSIEGSFVGVIDHESNRHNQLGFTRSRSFHTLQEYAAMVVERKRWLTKQKAYPEDPVTNIKVHNSYAIGTSSETCYDVVVDQVKYCLRDEEDEIIKEKSLIEESVAVLETHRLAESSDIETRNALFTSCGNSRVNDQMNDDVVENVPRTGRFITTEKGLRRKAMAKKLTPLRIPSSSTIEYFPAIGNLRGWINGAGEQVYTSEAYVTPKFGSFCLQVPMKINKCIEVSVFEVEMVAAFEQAMQQLEVEEKSVLKQIGGDFEEGDSDTTKEKKDAA